LIGDSNPAKPFIDLETAHREAIRAADVLLVVPLRSTPYPSA
jgi:hypothetical protein